MLTHATLRTFQSHTSIRNASAGRYRSAQDPLVTIRDKHRGEGGNASYRSQNRSRRVWPLPLRRAKVIQKRFGHSTVAITIDIYGHLARGL